MQILALIVLFLALCDSLQRGMSKRLSLSESEMRAGCPPRGWNSYDSFCWTISEEEFLQNAELVAQRLHSHGYEYVVVDYLWYRRKVKGASVDSLGFDVIDEWGRMIPDPGRWPSSKEGKGFTEIANRVHGLGLKFGIHVMRGISTQAFNANTPILDINTGKAYEESGRKWYAKDIGIKELSCQWMRNGFMSVDTKLGAGRAFLSSLYHQYAAWGVDFVKHDCVFGDDLNIDEISFVSKVLSEINRPILYSLSPGTSVTPSMAKGVSSLVNMYRITGDDWDTWGDVASHFDVSRDFAAANMIGANGLQGKSWPDLDMLPLGWLTVAGTNDGPHRKCNLNLDEQRTQMTLWSMVKSPLMFGGDMRNLDETTFSLITNPTLLEINSFSSNNMEFPYLTGEKYFESRRYSLTSQPENYEVRHASKDLFMGLSSCKDKDVSGWSVKANGDDLEKVCWKENSKSEHHASFCLYKEKLILESDEEMQDKRSHGKFRLLATEGTDFCLGASASRKLTSKEFRRGSFSPCRLHANQMWELKYNGTLANGYSGLCASMKRNQADAGAGGTRSWLATGRRGEIYLAFFNLNSDKTLMSTTISDIAKALPRGNQPYTSCACTELWTGTNFGFVTSSVSMVVQPHGSSLFTLSCT